MKSATLFTCGCFLIAALIAARAEVRTAAVFGDHMVLQQDRPVPVWGTAAPGEEVVVNFDGQKAHTKADSRGKWKVSLPPMKAGAKPHEMTVAGADNTLVFTNVLVGEVWLCSGQSNMGLEVRKSFNVSNDLAAANYAGIRCFTTGSAPSTNQGYVIAPDGKQRRYPLTPQETCLGAWQTCNPRDTKNWSAVGYFFARNLHLRLQVTVGIVVASYGATAIESWISIEGLKSIPSYRQRALAFEEVAAAYVANTNSYPASLASQAAKYREKCLAWFEQLDAREPGLKNRWMDPAFDAAAWQTMMLPVTATNNPLGERPAARRFRSRRAGSAGKWNCASASSTEPMRPMSTVSASAAPGSTRRITGLSHASTPCPRGR